MKTTATMSSAARNRLPLDADRPLLATAGVLLVRDGAAVLLQHRDNKPEILHPGQWGIPGGAIEGDETAAQAAVRELLEETGYQAGDITPLVDQRWELPAMTLDRHVFWAHYDGQQPIHCFEGQEMRWVAFADIAALDVCPGHDEALARLSSLFRNDGGLKDLSAQP